jgi:hypothetical protein
LFLQRLPGGLAELEALAEQLPPEDRAPDPMPSSPPRSHRIRERDKLTLQEYFTTGRAPLRGASMRARGPRQRSGGND